MLFVYLILVAISVLFYIMYVGVFSFYLMVFLITLPTVLLGINLYLSRKIRVSFASPVLQTSGQGIVHPQIKVENPTLFPVANLEIIIEHCSAVGSGSNATKIYTPILPKENQLMTLNVASLHLGSINMKIKRCRVYDILRLFKLRLRGRDNKNTLKDCVIFILPPYIRMENIVTDYTGLGIETDEYSPDKKGDDPSQIFDIHQYIEGDKPNRIHWKLSAKQDEIMVKDYSLMTTYAIHIFVNLNTNNADSYDAMISSAAAISMLLTEKNVAHTIEWFDSRSSSCESVNIRDEDDHYNCMDMLIKSKTYHDEQKAIYPFYDDIDKAVCGHLIIVSEKLSDDEMHSIVNSGYASRFSFAIPFAANMQLPEPPSDNAVIIPVSRNQVAQSFNDIVF